MAKAAVKMPDDFLLKLSRLGGKTDEFVPRVLDTGGEIVSEAVRRNLSSSIGKSTKRESRSTGELVSALGVTPARLDKNGNYDVKVGFSEHRSDGKSNAMIANVLEYGKHGQPAKPFLTPAVQTSKKACIEAMKAKLDEEVNNV